MKVKALVEESALGVMVAATAVVVAVVWFVDEWRDESIKQRLAAQVQTARADNKLVDIVRPTPQRMATVLTAPSWYRDRRHPTAWQAPATHQQLWEARRQESI